jgi:hypothetical protein
MASLGERFLRWCERRHSLFGPDVYADYSHAYVWQANQIAHGFLGLLATVVAALLLRSAFGAGPPLAAALVLAAYVAKEAIDYLIATRLTEGVFRPKRREILADGAADTLFVAAGALLAVSLLSLAEGEARAWFVGLAVVLCVGLFFALSALALPAKHRFDASGLRVLVRLPSFPRNFADADGPRRVRAWVRAVRRDQEGRSHLVIHGPPGSGRTTLGLSIGAEVVCAARRTLRYLGASRLIETVAAGAPAFDAEKIHALIVDEISGFRQTEWETLALLVGANSTARADVGAAASRLPRHVLWILSGGLCPASFQAALADAFPQARIARVALAGPLSRRNRTA